MKDASDGRIAAEENVCRRQDKFRCRNPLRAPCRAFYLCHSLFQRRARFGRRVDADRGMRTEVFHPKKGGLLEPVFSLTKK
jgi:hypothetical protein